MATQGEPEPLHRLHALARAFAGAITGSNQLPEGFPKQEMCRVAEALRGLDATATPEDRQVLVHAQAKLRETRQILRDASDEEMGFFELERTHNALFAEIDVLLAGIPARELVSLRPSAEGPALVVRRAEVETPVAALERRIEEMQGAADRSITLVDQSRHIDIALVRVGELRVNLEGLLKVAASFKAELAGRLIDLDWLSHLTGRIAALTESLGRGIDSLKRATDELAELVRDVERVHRLSQRVVDGGRSLFRLIKRALARRGGGGPLRPGHVFRDVEAAWCPELVVVPAGRFLMGSPEGEEGRTDWEGPQHEVMIGAAFALGRYPVTFDEYDAFCAATGRAKPDDEGWGRGRRPVINVSWEDAQAYVAWLRGQTEQLYRLPSEAEWEYACRAGTTTPFWTGATIGTDQANYGGISPEGPGRKDEYRRQTTPVDTFAANPFGLHDMHGNAWEWVEDRWHDSYEGAPADGSAWVEGEEFAQVVRGGSWYYDPGGIRSATRGRYDPANCYHILGFRVARILTPSAFTLYRRVSGGGGPSAA